jgi:ubiquinone biosynthesis protein Coq4
MKDLEKITQVVDRFVALDQFSKVPQDTLGLVSIEIAIKLGEYQAKHGNLDLDSMLTGERYDFVHDIVGIWAGDNFTPRFTKH